MLVRHEGKEENGGRKRGKLEWLSHEIKKYLSAG